MTPFERLEKVWCRKYYSFTVSGGPFVQPGDGHYVLLSGGGRKVQVSEYDVPTPPGEDEDDWQAGLSEVVGHALDLWYADTSPKWYRVFFEAAYSTFDGAQHWHKNTYMAYFEAASEDEARAKLLAHYPPHEEQPKIIQVWERVRPTVSECVGGVPQPLRADS